MASLAASFGGGKFVLLKEGRHSQTVFTRRCCGGDRSGINGRRGVGFAKCCWGVFLASWSVQPAPAFVRAILPILDFYTVFPLTRMLLDLTSASMFQKVQINSVGTPLKNLALKCNHLMTKIE